jgi:hypothetical protein
MTTEVRDRQPCGTESCSAPEFPAMSRRPAGRPAGSCPSLRRVSESTIEWSVLCPSCRRVPTTRCRIPAVRMHKPTRIASLPSPRSSAAGSGACRVVELGRNDGNLIDAPDFLPGASFGRGSGRSSGPGQELAEAGTDNVSSPAGHSDLLTRWVVYYIITASSWVSPRFGRSSWSLVSLTPRPRCGSLPQHLPGLVRPADGRTDDAFPRARIREGRDRLSKAVPW